MNYDLHKRYINEKLNDKGEVESISFNVPENFNFGFDVVDVIAEQSPDKLALLWRNVAGDEKRITFGELKLETDKVAAMLQKLGVKRGDKVMLVLKRHFEYWYFCVALHKLGAAAIPATSQLAVKDLKYRFEKSGCKMIVVTSQDDVIDRVDEATQGTDIIKVSVRGKRDGFVCYEEESAKETTFARPTGELASQNGDMLLLYFTSGTTGMPKMVAHDYTYPLGHIVTAKYWHKVDPNGLHLSIAESGWAKAAWGKIYGQWLMEAAIFVYDFDKFDPALMLTEISTNKITTFCAPPTMYRFFIKEDLSKYDLSNLKHAVTAGEALNPEVFEQFKKATGLALMEGFGQTEATLLAYTKYWDEPRPGSMGLPSFAYDVAVVDDDNKPVGAGTVGEIVVFTDKHTNPGLFRGYYLDDELTKSVWSDGIYHTGDTAWQDEDGYLWYVGRKDDLIKCSGYRIGPFEVESVLMEHPSVLECAVTGEPDPIRGQVVKATIVLAKGYTPSDELKKELQEHTKALTAFYKYPRIIDFVSELPKTISGKIRRTELRKKN